MFNLTYQGQKAFSLAKNISKKSRNSNTIYSQDLVEALIKTDDSSAGKVMFERHINRIDVKREILAAESVDGHSEKDPSLAYVGMSNPQPFEIRIKSKPVPFVEEQGTNKIAILDREYLVSDYVLYGLNYGKSLLNQRASEEIETQDILLGMVDIQDSNAFWLLLKLLILKMHGFYADPYTNMVSAKLDIHWYQDGSETKKQKHKQFHENLLEHKLLNPDYSLLGEYGRNLTQLAKEKKLSPVIGRKKEIKHLALVLNRKLKSNALLVGAAGVGKTAIAEGLAQEIVKGRIPTLASKRLIALDPDKFSLLMSKGLSTEVIEHLLVELSQLKDTILFIDEIQVLRNHGFFGLFDMLKPALARGELQLIGATTPLEAQDFFKNDDALMRRFETIRVEPLNRLQTDQVIDRSSNTYENFYHANYTEEAKRTAVDLALTYLPSSLPDSAFTILDNAGSLMVAGKDKEVDSTHTYIHDLHSLTKQLAIESKKSLNNDKVKEIKNSMKKLHEQYNLQQANGKKTKYTVKITEKDIIHATEVILGRILSKQDIAKAKKQRLVEGSSVFDLEDHLRNHIIGQDQAIKELSKAIMISKAGLRKNNAPIGTFFFAGLTGTGKTETAKQLAIEEFGSEKNLLRFNMPDFNGLGGQDLFIGSLLQKISMHPNSVILLDEIEKATPSLYHVLLSIMDEGILLPNSATNPDFSKSIIIMTSNIGASQMLERHVGFSKSSDQIKLDNSSTVLTAMRKRFTPEFINRLTKIIVFNRLDHDDLLKITNLLIEDKANLLLEKNIHLKWNSSVINHIVTNYADFKNGARPLERGIDESIMGSIAYKMLKHEVKPSQTINLSIHNDELSIEVTK